MATTNAAQLPRPASWGNPGHKYTAHGILRTTTGSFLPNPGRPSSFQPGNCNFQNRANQGN